jgi:hypothetical protein
MYGRLGQFRTHIFLHAVPFLKIRLWLERPISASYITIVAATLAAFVSSHFGFSSKWTWIITISGPVMHVFDVFLVEVYAKPLLLHI